MASRVNLLLLLLPLLACRPAAGARPVVPPAIAPAIVLLDSVLPSADRDALRRMLPDSAIKYHFSLGMWLRNNAGLWKGGPVADSLRAHGVVHPDDMSHVILQAYGFYLRGQPINLDSLIKTQPPAPKLESYEVSPGTPARDTVAVAVVELLYRDRACEVAEETARCSGPGLMEQPRDTLARYFDSTLVDLILRDRACAESSGSICNLDYSPIWDSQDPGAADIAVSATNDPAVIEVSFRYPSNGTRIRIAYHMVRTKTGWRVHDIVSMASHASLRATLSRPISPE